MSQRVLAAVMVRVGFLFVAIAVPGLFTNIVKHIFGRARPGVGGSVDPSLFSPFSWPAAYASLPSGHATTAFSVLVAFGSLWPRARTVLLIYALLIAASRIVVTAHYPTDVAAGALVGTARRADGAPLFRAARPGFLGRSGRRAAPICRARRSNASNRLPASYWLNKKRAHRPTGPAK